MKICFLLGSGISLPAGLPSVAQITERILLGGEIRDERVSEVLVEEGGKELRQITLFLHWLKVQAACRYAAWPYRTVSYEDLAYLAGQIEDDATDNYENPALAPFTDRAYSRWDSFADQQLKIQNFGALAHKALDYIHQVVAKLLTKSFTAQNYEHLCLLLHAAEEKENELNLFTLNHDTLLESFFESEKVKVIDGFEYKSDEKIRRWNPSLFDEPASVRLFKLHGSVNWHAFGPKKLENRDDPWREEFVGSSPWGREVDQRYEILPNRRLVLTGTFNKILDYTNEVFLELYHRFYRVLADSEHFIVCGYGFGDKGINERIVGRMCSQRPCKLLVIDPAEVDEIEAKARYAISGKLNIWRKEGRFVHWRHSVADGYVTWERIVRSLL